MSHLQGLISRTITHIVLQFLDYIYLYKSTSTHIHNMRYSVVQYTKFAIKYGCFSQLF